MASQHTRPEKWHTTEMRRRRDEDRAERAKASSSGQEACGVMKKELKVEHPSSAQASSSGQEACGVVKRELKVEVPGQTRHPFSAKASSSGQEACGIVKREMKVEHPSSAKASSSGQEASGVVEKELTGEVPGQTHHSSSSMTTTAFHHHTTPDRREVNTSKTEKRKRMTDTGNSLLQLAQYVDGKQMPTAHRKDTMHLETVPRGMAPGSSTSMLNTKPSSPQNQKSSAASQPHPDHHVSQRGSDSPRGLEEGRNLYSYGSTSSSALVQRSTPARHVDFAVENKLQQKIPGPEKHNLKPYPSAPSFEYTPHSGFLVREPVLKQQTLDYGPGNHILSSTFPIPFPDQLHNQNPEEISESLRIEGPEGKGLRLDASLPADRSSVGGGGSSTLISSALSDGGKDGSLQDSNGEGCAPGNEGGGSVDGSAGSDSGKRVSKQDDDSAHGKDKKAKEKGSIYSTVKKYNAIAINGIKKVITDNEE